MMKASLTSEEFVMPQVLPHLHPLDEFYAHAGRELPPIEKISGDSMPEPYKSLLVHEGDMTPTLEKFHGSELHLRVLQRELREGNYYRQVVLLTQDNEPVEFGAIKIVLNHFPEQARQEILEETIPLGSILARHGITHHSRPKAYLQFRSDDFVNEALQLDCSQLLYGRRNTLSTPDFEPLAEIVEILPPAKTKEK